MTKEEIRFQVALSCIQGVLEAKHGIIGEALPSLAVAESLRIADEFVKQWFDKTAKPAELSEEDEKIRKELWEYFHDMQLRSDCDFSPSFTIDDILAYLERQGEPRDYRKLYEDVVKSDWFKENYAGKFLGEEQKPAEWSEEDEKWFKEIELMALSFSNSADYRSKFFNWLKSIRLKLHWKPSEYTLSLVKKVANGEMLTQMEQMAMGTLYDELQKLL